VFTQAVAQPVYTPPAYTPPAQQPRAMAWAQPVQAQPAAPVYRPAVPVPPALAWNEPPRPAPVYAPPPRRTVVARVDRDEDETPVRRPHAVAHQSGATRVALNIPRVPPQRGAGGLHFISSAMAAEVYTVHKGHKTIATPVSFNARGTSHGHAATTWKLHATGPVQVHPACHKDARGKLVCGPAHI